MKIAVQRFMKRYLIGFAVLSLLSSCLDTNDFNEDIQDDSESGDNGKADGPTISISAAILGKRFAISRSGLSGGEQPYKPNGSYVAMSLPVATFVALKTAVQSASAVTLKSRGEAHITVLTPPEFGAISRLVPMSELDALAKTSNLQKSNVTAKCLGVGQSRKDQAVFVIVEAAELTQFRNVVAQKYIARGGAATAFDPASFHPHITVGFTKRDLHQADGVIKSMATCPNQDNLQVQ